MRRVSAAIVLMALAGCATTYQDGSGWTGGFSEVQLDKNVFKVSFNGNAYTSIERVEELALLRGADLTLQHGFSYFVVTEGRSREEVQTYTSPVSTTSKTSRKGNGDLVTQTTMYGGDTQVSKFPSTVNTIVAYHRKPDMAATVYDAQFLCGSLGKKYKVKCGVRPPM